MEFNTPITHPKSLNIPIQDQDYIRVIRGKYDEAAGIVEKDMDGNLYLHGIGTLVGEPHTIFSEGWFIGAYTPLSYLPKDPGMYVTVSYGDHYTPGFKRESKHEDLISLVQLGEDGHWYDVRAGGIGVPLDQVILDRVYERNPTFIKVEMPPRPVPPVSGKNKVDDDLLSF